MYESEEKLPRRLARFPISLSAEETFLKCHQIVNFPLKIDSWDSGREV